jgi:hypothetical protein
MVMQGIKVESFRLAMIVIGVTSFGTAFGMPYIVPVSCLIAGAFKSGSIDKRFGQIHMMAINIVPVTA